MITVDTSADGAPGAGLGLEWRDACARTSQNREAGKYRLAGLPVGKGNHRASVLAIQDCVADDPGIIRIGARDRDALAFEVDDLEVDTWQNLNGVAVFGGVDEKRG